MKHSLSFLAILLLLSSCKTAIKPANLYGAWKYIKVENPNEDPPDSVSKYDLQVQSPYIKFTKDDSLIIVWSGKALSQGKFTTSGNNINFTESLPGGKTRQFPFFVSKLDGKDLVFETLGTDGTRVTAVKE